MDHKVPLVVDLPGYERVQIGEAIVNESGYVIAEVTTEYGKQVFGTDLSHVSIGFQAIGFQGSIPVDMSMLTAKCTCYDRGGITYKHKCAIHRSVNQ